MTEPQWTYQDIVNHFVKIIGNGTFTVETINESILLKMLDSKGIKIPVEKSYRDIDKDYKMHLQDIGITMIEPQLSAEMRAKYNDLRPYIKSGVVQEKIDEVFNWFATALEEQRAMFVEEVRNRRATIKWLWGKQKTDDECFLMVMKQVQRIAEFAKLNQLKGE